MSFFFTFLEKKRCSVDSKFTKYFIDLGGIARLFPPISEHEIEDMCILDLEYTMYYETAQIFKTDNYKSTKIKYDQMVLSVLLFDKKPCPFCKGTMVNNAIIQPYSKFLNCRFFHITNNSGIYRDVGTWLGSLGWTCYDCETAETQPPKKAKIWRYNERNTKKKGFIDVVFENKSFVECMSFEGLAGRGWLLKVDDIWFCNKKSKDELMKLWHLS